MDTPAMKTTNSSWTRQPSDEEMNTMFQTPPNTIYQFSASDPQHVMYGPTEPGSNAGDCNPFLGLLPADHLYQSGTQDYQSSPQTQSFPDNYLGSPFPLGVNEASRGGFMAYPGSTETGSAMVPSLEYSSPSGVENYARPCTCWASQSHQYPGHGSEPVWQPTVDSFLSSPALDIPISSPRNLAGHAGLQSPVEISSWNLSPSWTPRETTTQPQPRSPGAKGLTRHKSAPSKLGRKAGRATLKTRPDVLVFDQNMKPTQIKPPRRKSREQLEAANALRKAGGACEEHKKAKKTVSAIDINCLRDANLAKCECYLKRASADNIRGSMEVDTLPNTPFSYQDGSPTSTSVPTPFFDFDMDSL